MLILNTKAMDNDKIIEILNRLVEINNDRTQGYQTALKEIEKIENTELRSLLNTFLKTSEKYIGELSKTITHLGGIPTQDTNPLGKIHRTWMDLKASVTDIKYASILASCQYGDHVAMEAYEDVLKNNLQDIAIPIQEMLNTQYIHIKTEHDRVKNLVETLS
jgi:uncharacterized protein (TIGR02284 family)